VGRSHPSGPSTLWGITVGSQTLFSFPSRLLHCTHPETQSLLSGDWPGLKHTKTGLSLSHHLLPSLVPKGSLSNHCATDSAQPPVLQLSPSEPWSSPSPSHISSSTAQQSTPDSLKQCS
jgi:hypothetical protein